MNYAYINTHIPSKTFSQKFKIHYFLFTFFERSKKVKKKVVPSTRDNRLPEFFSKLE